MFTINKDKFFTILNDLNKTCIYRNVKDQYFMDIPKFKTILDNIDLNYYSLEYVQNRLITVKSKEIPMNLIKNIIICPIDTKYKIENEECENINYTFPIKEKKTYLTTNDNNNDNEKYCIKGCMNPAILNSILLYMINTNLIPIHTMVIFTLKGNESKFDGDDIIEYLQKYKLNKFNNDLLNIIKLDYTSLEKGYPKKDYIGNISIESDYTCLSNNALNKFMEIENFDCKRNKDFEIKIKSLPKIKDNYKKLIDYFNASVYIEDRIFIFNDEPINNKYNVLVYNSFLIEWDTINKYINQLYNYIKRSDI